MKIMSDQNCINEEPQNEVDTSNIEIATRKSHRYNLVFRFLPILLRRVAVEGECVEVLTDKEFWEESYRRSKVSYDFDFDDIQIEFIKEKGLDAILYRFPQPLIAPEALFGAIVKDKGGKNNTFRYYTLEMYAISPNEGDKQEWILCGVDYRNNAHINFGITTTDTSKDEFIRLVRGVENNLKKN